MMKRTQTKSFIIKKGTGKISIPYLKEETISHNLILQNCKYLQLDSEKAEISLNLYFNPNLKKERVETKIVTIEGDEFVIDKEIEKLYYEEMRSITNSLKQQTLTDCSLRAITLRWNNKEKDIKVYRSFDVDINLDKMREILRKLLQDERKLIVEILDFPCYSSKVVQKEGSLSSIQIPEQYEEYLSAYINAQSYLDFSLPNPIKNKKMSAFKVESATFYLKEDKVLVDFKLNKEETITIAM